MNKVTLTKQIIESFIDEEMIQSVILLSEIEKLKDNYRNFIRHFVKQNGINEDIYLLHYDKVYVINTIHLWRVDDKDFRVYFNCLKINKRMVKGMLNIKIFINDEYEIIDYEKAQSIMGTKRGTKVYKDRYLYFFSNELGNIKIGHAVDVEERRKNIEAQSGIKIKLVKKLENCAKYESALHDKFDKYKLIGEWFTPNKKLIDFIENINIDNIQFISKNQTELFI